MKFVNPYHWLYTKTYLKQFKLRGRNDHFTVVVTLSLMISFNLAVIAGLFDTFFRISISGLMPNVAYIAIPVCYVSLVLANYFYFFYKGRHKKILLEFDVNSSLKERYYYMPGLIYDILSLAALFAILPLKSKYGIH